MCYADPWHGIPGYLSNIQSLESHQNVFYEDSTMHTNCRVRQAAASPPSLGMSFCVCSIVVLSQFKKLSFCHNSCHNCLFWNVVHAILLLACHRSTVRQACSTTCPYSSSNQKQWTWTGEDSDIKCTSFMYGHFYLGSTEIVQNRCNDLRSTNQVSISARWIISSDKNNFAAHSVWSPTLPWTSIWSYLHSREFIQEGVNTFLGFPCSGRSCSTRLEMQMAQLCVKQIFSFPLLLYYSHYGGIVLHYLCE